MTFDFEPYRKEDGAIDLAGAYADLLERNASIWFPVQYEPRRAERFLMVLDDLHQITSPELAAIAIATAIELAAE